MTVEQNIMTDLGTKPVVRTYSLKPPIVKLTPTRTPFDYLVTNPQAWEQKSKDIIHELSQRKEAIIRPVETL